MITMKKAYLFIIIVELSLINIYLVYKQINLRKQLKEINEFSHELIIRQTNVNDNLKKLITLSNYTIKINSANSHLKNVFNENKVVLYITESNCGSCVQEALNYMDTLSQIIGKDKLLFMGNFITRKSFDDYTNGLSNYFGNFEYCNDAGFSEELNRHPLVFIAKKDLSIQALYIPDFNPKFAEEYYTKVLPSYFITPSVMSIIN